MSIVDERDLRQQLDRVLDAIMPPDAPVKAAVRKGKLIQAARSLGIVAGLAVVAGIGVGMPRLLNQPAREVSHARPTVMVEQRCGTAEERPAAELATGGCAWLKP
jgi:hypothetical protein